MSKMYQAPQGFTLGWRCWFDDGSVYDSAEYAWGQLPDDGLLVKVIYYGDGTRQTQCGGDYYFEAVSPMGVEPIRGFTQAQLEDITERYSSAVVKRGRWAPDAFYKYVQEVAAASRWDI